MKSVTRDISGLALPASRRVVLECDSPRTLGGDLLDPRVLEESQFRRAQCERLAWRRKGDLSSNWHPMAPEVRTITPTSPSEVVWSG